MKKIIAWGGVILTGFTGGTLLTNEVLHFLQEGGLPTSVMNGASYCFSGGYSCVVAHLVMVGATNHEKVIKSPPEVCREKN